MKPCECGCGEMVRRRFVPGHNNREPNAWSPYERFMAKVEKRGDDACWLWVGGINEHGYGRGIKINGTQAKAHRQSWEFHRGEIPDGFCVCHTCDNPPCVNPAHLFVATHAENMADCRRKGRSARRDAIGENNSMAKLNEDDVLEIRRIHGRTFRTHRDIARQFGVSASTVHNIVTRKSWRHI